MPSFRVHVQDDDEGEDHTLDFPHDVDVEEVHDAIVEECFPKHLYCEESWAVLVLDQGVRVNFRDLPEDFEFKYEEAYSVEFRYRAHAWSFAMRVFLGTLFWALMFSTTHHLTDSAVEQNPDDERLIHVVENTRFILDSVWFVVGMCIMWCV